MQHDERPLRFSLQFPFHFSCFTALALFNGLAAGITQRGDPLSGKHTKDV